MSDLEGMTANTVTPIAYVISGPGLLFLQVRHESASARVASTGRPSMADSEPRPPHKGSNFCQTVKDCAMSAVRT